MKKGNSDSFAAHITDLQTVITTLETTMIPSVVKTKEETTEKAKAVDLNEPARYAALVLQGNILEANLVTLNGVSLMLREFAHIWEQHKLLSEYVDEALGQTSDTIRAEFHVKQKALEETFMHDPIRLGIMDYLDKLKENNAKYQWGPGDV